jgi:hypothetical protein
MKGHERDFVSPGEADPIGVPIGLCREMAESIMKSSSYDGAAK